MSNLWEVLRSIYRSTINIVQANQLIRSSICIKSPDGILEVLEKHSYNHQRLHQIKLTDRDVFLFGAGKATIGMCQGFLEQIDSYNGKLVQGQFPIRISYGHLNVPFGSKVDEVQIFAKYNTSYHECGRNNIPDQYSTYYTQSLVNSLRKHVTTSVNPLVIGFISGGGSALLALPKVSVSLEDKQNVIKSLTHKGANIVELNTIRSCLSQVKHGQLAQQLFEWNPQCELISFIISDIIGDPIEMIASGPTILQSYKKSKVKPEEILHKYSLQFNEKIQKLIKSDSICDQQFKVDSVKVLNIIIGNNLIALNGAKQQAEKLGFKAIVIGSEMSGEARLIVRKLLEIVLNYQETQDDRSQYKGLVWLAGGEATIKMDGASQIGKGGRCQEMGLLFLDELSNMTSNKSKIDREIFALFAGTDGQDGPTPVAGVQLKWPPESLFLKQSNIWQLIHNALYQHDSYNFWNQYTEDKCLLRTGITGTNVMDIYCIMIHFGKIK